jgi:hypothetical protein
MMRLDLLECSRTSTSFETGLAHHPNEDFVCGCQWLSADEAVLEISRNRYRCEFQHCVHSEQCLATLYMRLCNECGEPVQQVREVAAGAETITLRSSAGYRGSRGKAASKQAQDETSSQVKHSQLSMMKNPRSVSIWYGQRHQITPMEKRVWHFCRPSSSKP